MASRAEYMREYRQRRKLAPPNHPMPTGAGPYREQRSSCSLQSSARPSHSRLRHGDSHPRGIVVLLDEPCLAARFHCVVTVNPRERRTIIRSKEPVINGENRLTEPVIHAERELRAGRKVAIEPIEVPDRPATRGRSEPPALVRQVLGRSHDTARPVVMLTTSAGLSDRYAAHRFIRSRRRSNRSER